ncbi:MAG: hypothetical protein ABSF32_09115 [Ignavibacteria bacterium]|jgi:hypothetical protein
MKTIKIFIVIIVVISSRVALTQIFCQLPTAISPMSIYESIDPPTLIWHSVVFGGMCQFYRVQFYDTLGCGGPYPYLWTYMDRGQDTIWYIENDYWNYYFPIGHRISWCIKVVSGDPLWSGYPCVPLKRLQAALPPVGLIYPSNNAIGVDTIPCLDWSRLDSATSYRVRIFNEPTLGSVIFDSVTNRDSLRVPAGRLQINTTYWWRVKPYKTGGEGPFSDVFCFTTFNPQLPPPAPFLVSPPNNSIGNPLSVTLVWNASPGAASYKVQLTTDSLWTFIFINDSTITGTSKVVSGLSILTKYFWRVNAKNANGPGPWSEVWNFKTLGPPTQVTLLQPPNNAVNVPTSYTFLWSKAIDQTTHLLVSNYWFERVTDTVSMANLLRDTTLADTTKTVTGMSYATSYFWRVKAKNQIDWGNFAPWFKFTTIPQPPALITLTVIPGGFYNTSISQLNMKDTIRIILVDSATCNKVDSARVLIDSVTFSATPTPSFARANTGKYYILVYHRNHLPIASRYTQQVTRGSTVSYDFTTDSAKTFGFNAIKVSTSPVLWGMIPGDANQDEYVDALDQLIWISQNGQNGFYSADFNGDTYVDALDQLLWIIYNGSSSFLPCGFIPSDYPWILKMKIESSNFWRKVIKQNQVKQNNSNKISK